ncbi:hypothetical protein [Cupriavidus necator]
MEREEIMCLIEEDAKSFYLPPRHALPAFVDILAECRPCLSAEDFITLIAVGSLIYREAQAEALALSVIDRASSRSDS